MTPSLSALSTISSLPRSGKVADRILRSMERRHMRFMGSVIEPGVGRGWRRLTIFWTGGREDRLLIAPWGAVRRMRTTPSSVRQQGRGVMSWGYELPLGPHGASPLEHPRCPARVEESRAPLSMDRSGEQ